MGKPAAKKSVRVRIPSHRCMWPGCSSRARFIHYWPEPALSCEREDHDFGPYFSRLDKFYQECAKGGYTPLDHVRESKRGGEECATILEAFLKGTPMPPPHQPLWESPRLKVGA